VRTAEKREASDSRRDTGIERDRKEEDSPGYVWEPQKEEEMNEQMMMFTDPLEEEALKILRSVADRLDDVFSSYYGGSRAGFSFAFLPSGIFYYADRSFNAYEVEPWVRRKTREEIRELFNL
jgi:hypothetical protein